jgi:hypothetical protein
MLNSNNIPLYAIEYILFLFKGFSRETARGAAEKIGIPAGRLDEVFTFLT